MNTSYHRNYSVGEKRETKYFRRESISPRDSVHPFDEIQELKVNNSLYNEEDRNDREGSLMEGMLKQPKFNFTRKSLTTAATKTPMVNLNNSINKFSILGIVCLVLAVVTGAGAVPLQVHLPLKSSFLKLSWRQMSMLPYLWVAGLT